MNRKGHYKVNGDNKPYESRVMDMAKIDQNSRVVSTLNAPDKNVDPGSIMDPDTWRALKKTSEKISQNKNKILISFIIEFFVFVVLIASWAHISSRYSNKQLYIYRNLPRVFLCIPIRK